ncbi:hypothetical protein CEXT_270701 [Caerostris extrusa]|uniref:Uncharacterized protein n=1 Tax=Caerostris extrusa TaxID=172846 RepID=A0AAV4RAB1_CAEEX|nr:hypothetical protein CEXT_270701 [Caerostris extrusa]
MLRYFGDLLSSKLLSFSKIAFLPRFHDSTEFVNSLFSESWIGRVGAIAWPSRLQNVNAPSCLASKITKCQCTLCLRSHSNDFVSTKCSQFG